ncbi:hypothetical protein D6779_01915 [Candidatus Parcubacteria bacterium]|nr:MAG: hypothetical protein D6779_01915 [Candidatus Parcubacteria bacterium]
MVRVYILQLNMFTHHLSKYVKNGDFPLDQSVKAEEGREKLEPLLVGSSRIPEVSKMQEPIPCPYKDCKWVFSTEESLQQHLKQKHIESCGG